MNEKKLIKMIGSMLVSLECEEIRYGFRSLEYAIDFLKTSASESRLDENSVNKIIKHMNIEIKKHGILYDGEEL